MDEKWQCIGWYSEYGYINIDIHILHLSSILSPINPTNNHPYQALKSKNLTSMNHKNNEKWNMIAKTVRDFPERSSEIQLLYNYLDPDLVPSPPILLYGPSGTKAFPHFSCHIQI